jgi:hypothetical protein
MRRHQKRVTGRLKKQKTYSDKSFEKDQSFCIAKITFLLPNVALSYTSGAFPRSGWFTPPRSELTESVSYACFVVHTLDSLCF